MIELRSDNTAGVAPEIVEAIVAINQGSAVAYGGDPLTADLQARVREVFGHDELWVVPVLSGTAANALGLASMTPPWGAIWCHASAHIVNNEGGAASALSGGAVMHPVGGKDGLIDPDLLRSGLDSVRWGDNHQSQPSVLSLTEPTDVGTLYSVEQLAELGRLSTDYGLAVHLDGARLANAIASLGCTPAELTLDAGVNTFSLGATKNGAMSAEAIVTTDERVAAELVYRTKRAGQVTSKTRFQSAQLLAYLADGLWLRLAEHANSCMQRLVDGIADLEVADRLALAYPARANMAFFDCSAADSQLLQDAGLAFYTMNGRARFVTSWATTTDEMDRAIMTIGETLTDSPGATGS